MLLKKLVREPLFWVGLVAKLLIIVWILPLSAMEWYLPFLNYTIAPISFDPWTNWIAHGGNSSAFPYGYVMWIFFLPGLLLCKLLSIDILFAYNMTLLVVDICLLLTLNKMFRDSRRLILAVYWLSPIVIVASYICGYNDLIPVFLLTLSLYFVSQHKPFYAGFLCITAVSAKFSMIISIPFFLIYFIQNKRLCNQFTKLILGMTIAILIFELPYFMSKAALDMLQSNVEMNKIYQFSASLNEKNAIYFLPLLYFVMLYYVWHIKRMNFDLFLSSLGLAFFMVILLTQAPLGWFVWILPLMVGYQCSHGKIAVGLSGLFSFFYVLYAICLNDKISYRANIFQTKTLYYFQNHNSYFDSLIITALVTTGIILALRIWLGKIKLNDYFRQSRKSFVIGIAGDSGSGKDTFSEALTNLLGKRCVSLLSGDDYHLWDRHKPMWQTLTHLNPKANNLDKFARDLLSLADGKSIISRHYDHEIGKMTHPVKIKSNDFIIASGLHAFYLPILRTCYNLTIYLDINEELRRFFKFNRDVQQRGHSLDRVLSSLQKREPDSKQFIHPQRAIADIIFSLKPIDPDLLKSGIYNNQPMPRLKLQVIFRNQLNEQALVRVLIGLCGLHVGTTMIEGTSEVELSIEGEVSSDDICMAAMILCPSMLEFLDIQPKWQEGMIGLMQLITLSQMNQAIIKRVIW